MIPRHNRLTVTRHAMAAIATALLLTWAATPAGAKPVPPSFADLAEGLLDAVVNISTSQTVAGERGIPLPDLPEGSPFQEFFKDFFERNQQRPQARRVSSLGSGFVIDPSGIVVTNAHVIEDADEIEVNFSDGTTLPATVRGRDPKTDLAVLDVKLKEGQTLAAVEFGTSDDLRVGDWVMAIGNPFGLGGTVTVGILSARNRDINAGPYDDFLQTDAAINRGNSGGPLFNIEGKVVGINTAIISPTGGSIGIGFAIPAETALPVIEQLRDYGETRRGWLGVRIQTVTDEIAKRLNMEDAVGALVAGVTEGGPAAEIGIETGDVVLEFDGKPITEMRELPRIVADTEIGKQVLVKIWRDGHAVEYTVTVARLDESEEQDVAALDAGEEEPEPPARVDVLGMTLSGITEELRAQFEIAEDAEGVVITGVEELSAAYEKGLREGDVIVEADQEAVKSPEAFVELVEKMQTDNRSSVLLLVRRHGGDMRYLAIKLNP